jgi:rhodanese-related sulfurtransferase/CBS domain-containing protein
MAEVIPKEIDRDSIRTFMRRGAQLVDVLPKEEYERLHLPGAISIPLSRISRRTADQIEWDQAVIVYSRDHLCDRSARAAWRLASMGFTQVFRYIGGKADWLANGLPVEGADSRATIAADLADLDVPTCQRDERLADIKTRVKATGWDKCVVVNDKLVVLGLLRPSDLEKADPTWPAEETMDRDPEVVRLNASPQEVFDRMQELRTDFLLVTFPDGKLFGLLKLKDVEGELS